MKMNYIFCKILIVLCHLFAAESIAEICNGVFKCVSSTSLRICLNGQLVTSEFYCPNSKYCSETSDTICTNIPYFVYNKTENPINKYPTNNATISNTIAISNITTPSTAITISLPKCIQEGRYPIANSGCKQFLFCIAQTNRFIKYIITCPSNTFYDPIEQKCNKYFRCPNTSITTITTESSIQGNCLRQGKFPISNTNCTKFLNCIVISNGFLEQIVECNNETIFDPRTGKCTKRYTCPIITETTLKQSIIITDLSILDSTTKTETPNDATAAKTNAPTIYFTTQETTNIEETLIFDITNDYTIPNEGRTTETTKTETTTEVRTIGVISTSLFLNDSLQEAAKNEKLECVIEGRFAISGVCCKKYILCIKTTASFKEKEYECPKYTNFDPVNGRCSKIYQCTEEECQTTSNDITNEVTTTEITTDTISITPTVPHCSVQGKPEIVIPECLEVGRFAILGVACKKFILCVKTSTGFREQVYECPNGTNFDIKKGRCLINYQCTEEECQTTPNDVTTDVTTDVKTTETTNQVTTTEITTTEILIIEMTTDVISTNPRVPNCSAQGEPEIVIPKCLEVGRISISGVACKKYILCVKTGTGFREQIYECPNGTNFNIEKGRCLKNYQCPEVDCQTTSNDVTTDGITTAITNEVTTTEITTDAITATPRVPNCSAQGEPEIVIPKCLEVGRISISGVACKKYILCVKTGTGFREQIYECPNGTNFNIEKGRCLKNYQCPEVECQTTSNDVTTDGITTEITHEVTTTEITTDAITTTPRVPNCSAQGEPEIVIPKCLEVGRISISGVACKKYILCVKTGTGFREQIYECPNGTNFNIEKGRCLKNYQCPEVECQTTSNDVTTDGITTEITHEVTTTEITTDAITTTPRVPNCSAQGEPEIVIPKCLEVGRISISGVACKKYILCVKTGTGFREQIYECPNGTNFNIEKGRCLKNYQCPEVECQTTSNDVTTDGITTEITHEVTTTEITTDAITTTPRVPNCSAQGEPEIVIPKCLEVGRISISGVACKKYILCVKTGTGFREQIYECPNGTNFNIEKGRCLKNYQCPEVECQTTSNDVTTDGITTEITHEVTTTEITTDAITTTPRVPNCSAQGEPEIVIPKCLEVGRISISGVACKKYILCVKTGTGFREQIYECPNGTNFNIEKGRCLKNYQCPEVDCQTTSNEVTTAAITTEITNEVTTTEITTDAITTTPRVPNCSAQGEPEIVIPKCVEVGRFAISGVACKKYILCVKTSKGFRDQVYECPNGTNFNIKKGRCLINYACPEVECQSTQNDITADGITTETTNEVTTTEITNEVTTTAITTDASSTSPTVPNCSVQGKPEIVIPECLEVGRFAILGVACKKYILCVETTTGFREQVYECPNGTNFDAEKGKCLKNHQCAAEVCQVTQNTEGITEIIIPSGPEVPVCSLPGKLEMPGTKCKKFVLCIEAINSFVSSVYSCPPGSFFNPITKHCSENYICEEEIIRTCTTVGLYPSPSDLNCTFYYDCAEQNSNNIQGILKECKFGYFDPILQQCSSSYICQNKNNSLLKAEVQNLISPRFLVDGQCTTVGRYLVEFSNCKNYVYCSANTDGSLKATSFTCPTTTVFNQAIQKCTSSYTCPDTFCVNNPGLIAWPNPNVKGCTTYIVCESVLDSNGMILGYKGVITYCPAGTRYNPMLQICDSMYICPTNNNGK